MLLVIFMPRSWCCLSWIWRCRCVLDMRENTGSGPCREVMRQPVIRSRPSPHEITYVADGSVQFNQQTVTQKAFIVK